MTTESKILIPSLRELEPHFKTWVKEVLQDERPAPDSANILLTRYEVGKKIHCSLPTIDRLIAKGLLKACRIGNRVLISSADLDAALTQIQKR